MSKVYSILVPIAGAVEVVVKTDKEIESDKEAYQLAIAEIEKSDYSIKDSTLDGHEVSIHSFEYYEKITEGNLCHVEQNEIYYMCLEDEDE